MALTRVQGIFFTTVLLLSGACDAAVEGPWCYNDNHCGPPSWVSYGHCGDDGQSPIDIVTSKAALNSSLGPLILSGYGNYKMLRKMENTGKTVHVKLKDGLLLSGGGLPDTYTAKALHFHWGDGAAQPGSEHFIDGRQYSMEWHIVHTRNNMSFKDALDDSEGIAVLAFLVQGIDGAKGKTAKAWEAFSKNLQKIAKKGSDTDLHSTVSIQDLMGSTNLGRYYRYSGSLTTPNCNPVVLWSVFPDSITVSTKVVAFFPFNLRSTDSSVGPHLSNNFRPLQKLQNRTVEASNSFKPRSAASRVSQPVALLLLFLCVSTRGVLPI